MSKPINVEAQRVNKILNDTVCKHPSRPVDPILAKLKVLALLNSDFFEEVFKKEEEELCNLHCIPSCL